jgi:hypothetical protein
MSIRTAAVTPRCFPSDDRQFEDCVRRLLAEGCLAEDSESCALQARLQATYPAARVAVRSTLANLGSDAPVWYVFRDGHA